MYENNAQGFARGTAVGMSGFIAGALLGASVALLLAPASGRETRNRLGGAAKRVGNTMRDRVDNARQTLGDLGEDARTALDKGREAVTQRHQDLTSRTKSV